MASWLESSVGCPFYKYDDGKKCITCEGCVTGCSNRSLFNSQKKQRSHMLRFCCDMYRECPIYQMLAKKYE